jgi:8-oxo-dGTP pyrophosphatase MutT (NUDIX family)
LADRLHAALSRDVAPDVVLLSGDHPDIKTSPDVPAWPAAVLVAITERREPGVILTQRTETLRKHAGQIAFPGGRVDAGEDVVTAALREAEEEIALSRDHVTVIGQADGYRTVTGFQVTPVIGVVPPDLLLQPSEAEVASVFEVPLAFLLDPDNHVAAQVEWQGRMRYYYEILWHDRRIWGATAAMIVNLARRLQWA